VFGMKFDVVCAIGEHPLRHHGKTQ
jgi:hypothetical protein